MRLFVDMDGTIARFHDEVNYLEQMYEQGFFERLLPFERCIDGIKLLHTYHPDMEIYIISSCIDGEPPHCFNEKNKWLDKHLPFINREHRLFPKMNEDKTLYVPDGVKADDFLYDDYNVNLEQWQNAGGIAIKCKNNINHKGLVGALWQGAIVTNDCDSMSWAIEMARTMQQEKNKQITLKDEEVEEV